MARKPLGKYRQREIRTVGLMIELYEKHHPETDDNAQYKDLFNYAIKRLERCHFGEDKPACKHCPIHCYQPARREAIKAIMRWSGPRMLLRHPILAIRHLIDDHRPVPDYPKPKKETAPKASTERATRLASQQTAPVDTDATLR
ncbi:nitrous oxide-stimulated promoter family protein [Pectobacterium aroidearum]|uniref:Nitrous oxide-stimulated promoter family protein n=2 Tax=Pectobacterium aroidearum TaxID=1201031 RepID=A0ABR5Z8J7_9GAMM|nr:MULTISPECIES: nitrous oxide-stimulated promoter family protein [Pectobacterium]MBA5198108.1 nitrous oxide-stimulated promoter family protein [Pectobacterium aroidearum]MBA5227388.1 nitrous oxide-stimulated promoter family protein [Pectobacterium aroidearum]MBA5230901.1 nitrous oxide-stimulated promoter family protein [Pectobacterium aroidearum]MBA5736047.1 nitrous oxide-stimulated promoter family protein [Pectobacterium aroidearum]UXK02193.1 nitrous oxide-stimulated promoter family protein 